MRILSKRPQRRDPEVERLRDELDRNLTRFCEVAESSVDAVVVTDEDRRITSLNRAARRLFGYEAPEVEGQLIDMLFAESSRERERAAFGRVLDLSLPMAPDPLLRVEGLASGGRVFPVTLSLSCWTARSRSVAATLRADTERRAGGDEDLRMSGLADAHVRDAIVVSTAGGRNGGPTILYANRAFTKMTGYTESEVLGRSFGVLAGPRTSRTALLAINQRLRRGDAVSAELIAYRKDGHQFLLEWEASPVVATDGSVRRVTSIQRDVTEERSVERALRRADRDALTGLPTRAALERRIRLSIARSRERPDFRFALLFVDMDGFKAVNDDYGHLVGDRLLASAARRLERTIRPGDFLARFGGDEFVVLLHFASDVSDVTMAAERVRDCMEAPFEIQGKPINVAASIGVAMSAAAHFDAADVIRDADAAMYRAKRSGGGRIEYSG